MSFAVDIILDVRWRREFLSLIAGGVLYIETI